MSLVKKRADEVLTESEMKKAFEEMRNLTGYVGFELSGFFHIGNGVILGRQVANMMEAGINMNILLADWHSLINNKLGGDMDAIQAAGEYFELAFRSVGANGSRIKYVWGSDLVNTSDYWLKVVKISKNSTITRMVRTLPIMGRKETKEMEAAFLMYGAMQAADIFQMDLDFALGGMDQRNVHVLAREASEKLGYKKPICVHTPMLMGLKGPGSRMDSAVDLADIKMSKSKPETCIFLHDGPKAIKRKLQRAHCPQGVIENNPVIDIARLVLYQQKNFKLRITRPEKFGGDIDISSFDELSQTFQANDLHPLDLKNSVSDALATYLKDTRNKMEKKDDVMQTMSRLTGVPVDFE